MHEAGNAGGLRDWIAIGTAALPDRERAEVMVLLMHGYLYLNYQLPGRDPAKRLH